MRSDAITVSPYAGEAYAIEVRQEIERLDPALAKLVELSVLSERRYKANFQRGAAPKITKRRKAKGCNLTLCFCGLDCNVTMPNNYPVIVAHKKVAQLRSREPLQACHPYRVQLVKSCI